MLNTFGSLAVVGTLTLSAFAGVYSSFAYAYTPTLDNSETKTYLTGLTDSTLAKIYTDDQVSNISSGYTVTDITTAPDTASSYYATFTVQTADANGSITSTIYGVSLKGSNYKTDSTDVYTSLQSLIPSLDFNSNYKITTTPSTTSISFTIGSDTFYLLNSDGSEITLTDNRIVADGSDIDADFVGNTDTEHGGAIYNNSGTINSIIGDFIGNYVTSSTSSDFGGAIYNSGTISNTISGDFIANYITSSSSSSVYARGGAIYSSGTIDNITGSFIGNFATSTSISDYSAYANGGAINSSNKIGTIIGDFIGNSTSVSNQATATIAIDTDKAIYTIANGGAIYNNGGTIDSIIGDFIANSVSATSDNSSNTANANGGAISNTGIITAIAGDFINNSVESSTNSAYGGAVYNNNNSNGSSAYIYYITGDFIANTSGFNGGGVFNTGGSTIGTLTGDFIANTASSGGGGIFNADSSTVSTISGDFIANYTSGTTNSSYGGAIANNGTIDTITGDFSGNYATSTSGSVYGGAIYNKGTISKTISGDFIGNYLSASASVDALGGAIYTKADITFDATNTTNTFSDNYITKDNDVTKTYNAIYATNSSTLNFTMTGTGSFLVNDSIDGSSYSVSIAGDSTSTADIFYLNDAISNADTLTVSDTTLELGTYTHTNGTKTIGSITYSSLNLSGSSTLSINAGTETISANSNLAIKANEGFTVKSGTFDISDYTLSVESNASLFNTTGTGTLKVDLSNFGYSLVDTGVLTDEQNGSIATIFDNDSNLILTDVGFDSMTKDAYDAFLASYELSTFVDNSGTIELYGVTIIDIITLSNVADGTGYASTVYAGTLSENKTVKFAGIVENTYLDPDLSDSVIESGSKLTLTGENDTALLDKGSLTNNGELILGSSDVTTAEFRGTFTNTATTSLISNVTFSEDVTSSGDLTITNGASFEKGLSTTGGTLNFDGSNIIIGDVSVTDTSVNVSSGYAVLDTLSGTNSSVYIKDAYAQITNNPNQEINYYVSESGTLTFGTDTSSDTQSTATQEEFDSLLSLMGLTETSLINGFTTSDAIFIHNTGTTLTMGTGSLIVDTGVTSSGTVGTTSPTGLYFGENSAFILNTETLGTNLAIDGNSTSLYVADSSKLGLLNANANTYTILENFASVAGSLWTLDNIYVGSSLFEVTNVTGDAMTSAYQITVGTNTNNSLYDGLLAEILTNAVKSDTFGTDSSYATERFLAGATQTANVGDEKKQGAILEGNAQQGAVAGVPTATYRANRSSVETLQPRQTEFSNSSSSAISLVTYDDNGSVKDRYNNVIQVADNENTPYLLKHSNALTLWAMPLYAHESINGMDVGSYTADYNTDIYGVSVGIDKTLTNISFADIYRLGLSFNLGTGTSTTDGDFDNIESNFDFFGISAYGAIQIGNLNLNADLGYTKNNTDIKQDLSSYSMENTKSNVDSDLWHLDIQGEYVYRFENNINLIPYLGLNLITMKTEDYNVEADSALGGTIFNIESERQNILSVPVGIKVNKNFQLENGWNLNPQAEIGAIFATGDLKEISTSRMPGIDGVANMEMQVIDEFTGTLGFGISAIREDVRIGLDYTLQLSDHRTAHGVTGIVEIKF